MYVRSLPQDFFVDGPIRFLEDAVYLGPNRRQANRLIGDGRDHAQPQPALPHDWIKICGVRVHRHSTPHSQFTHPRTSWFASDLTNKFFYRGRRTSQMRK